VCLEELLFHGGIVERHLDLLVRHIALLKSALGDEHQRAPSLTWALWCSRIICTRFGDCRREMVIIPTAGAGSSPLLPSAAGRRTGFRQPHREGRARDLAERFWEHTIRDEEDLTRHLDYVHFNPVKHGWRLGWPIAHSTFPCLCGARSISVDWAEEDFGMEIAGMMRRKTRVMSFALLIGDGFRCEIPILQPWL